MKCTVCGHEFELKKENRYTTIKNEGIFGPTKYYDCFDCPRCGCQIVVGTRLEKIEESEVECDVCQEKDD